MGREGIKGRLGYFRAWVDWKAARTRLAGVRGNIFFSAGFCLFMALFGAALASFPSAYKALEPRQAFADLQEKLGGPSLALNKSSVPSFSAAKQDVLGAPEPAAEGIIGGVASFLMMLFFTRGMYSLYAYQKSSGRDGSIASGVVHIALAMCLMGVSGASGGAAGLAQSLPAELSGGAALGCRLAGFGLLAPFAWAFAWLAYSKADGSGSEEAAEEAEKCARVEMEKRLLGICAKAPAPEPAEAKRARARL